MEAAEDMDPGYKLDTNQNVLNDKYSNCLTNRYEELRIMLKDCFRERVLSRGLAAGLVTADSSGSYYFGHHHPALRQKRVRGAHQRHSDLLQGET